MLSLQVQQEVLYCPHYVCFLLQKTSGGVYITVPTVLKWATEAHTAQTWQTVLTTVASTPRPPLHLECLLSSSSFCLAAQVKASLHQTWSKK